MTKPPIGSSPEGRSSEASAGGAVARQREPRGAATPPQKLIAVFGGSFDPPHVGHVLGAAYVQTVEKFDRVLVVPTFSHAFGKALSPFEQRVEMVRLAMRDLARVEISTIEATLETPSLMLRTIQALQRAHPDWVCRLVVGTDVLAEKSKWHSFDEVARLAPPLVLDRAGAPREGGPSSLLPEVSSTTVRERLSSRVGPAVNDAELERLVPRAVLEYIDAQGLYR